LSFLRTALAFGSAGGVVAGGVVEGAGVADGAVVGAGSVVVAGGGGGGGGGGALASSPPALKDADALHATTAGAASATPKQMAKKRELCMSFYLEGWPPRCRRAIFP